jgi:phosphatidylethanolamine-binding protein (PEBP) family uncharacterized protein
MDIFYNNEKITNKEKVELSKVQNQPVIKFNSKNKYYTIIMADPDAPSKDDPKYKYWLHWIKVNIYSNELNTGEDLIDFAPPTPPSGTGYHRYLFILCEQPNKLDFKKPLTRKNFSIASFIKENKLKMIDHIYYKTKSV